MKLTIIAASLLLIAAPASAGFMLPLPPGYVVADVDAPVNATWATTTHAGQDFVVIDGPTPGPVFVSIENETEVSFLYGYLDAEDPIDLAVLEDNVQHLLALIAALAASSEDFQLVVTEFIGNNSAVAAVLSEHLDHLRAAIADVGQDSHDAAEQSVMARQASENSAVAARKAAQNNEDLQVVNTILPVSLASLLLNLAVIVSVGVYAAKHRHRGAPSESAPEEVVLE